MEKIRVKKGEDRVKREKKKGGRKAWGKMKKKNGKGKVGAVRSDGEAVRPRASCSQVSSGPQPLQSR